MKKGILINSIIFLVLIVGCVRKEINSLKSTFVEEVKKRDIETFKKYTTRKGIKRLEYYFGSLDEKESQAKLFDEFNWLFLTPDIVKESDSLVYFLSNRSDGAESINTNTITFIKKDTLWLIDDYRQGK